MDSCTFQFIALNNNKITVAHTATAQSRDTVNGLPAFLMYEKLFYSHRYSEKNGERKIKITRKQIEEWNEKCGNGFKVNERQATLWGQKRLHKYIQLSPEYLLEVSIEWKTKRDFWNKPWVYPVLRFNKWREKGDLLSSTFDMEYEVRLQEDRKRKNFNDLLKLSNADNGLKDEQLLQRYMNHFEKREEI